MSCDHDHHTPEARKKIESNIAQYGCHLVMIEKTSDKPGFVYSIGLHQQYNQPEIICIGLALNLAGGLINDVCGRMQKGESFLPGKLYDDFLEGYAVQFIPVDKDYYSYYFGYGCWFKSNADFPALQLIWPDKENYWPWDDAINKNWKFTQPLLDRNTDFKFYEERNLCVLTTRQFLEGHPILFVYHDEEGDWQFHCSDDVSHEEGIAVCLEDVIKSDPSLNEVFHLDPGESAWRAARGEAWNYD